MSDPETAAQRIAALNDEFRGPRLPGTSRVPGRSFMTAGVAALDRDVQAEILKRVRNFSDFTFGNDPHQEHDFGSICVRDEQLFWKIDYFEDDSMQFGAEEPSDPSRSFRVLTVMLAAEY